jgi:hypothetical protein
MEDVLTNLTAFISNGLTEDGGTAREILDKLLTCPPKTIPTIIS